MLDHFPLKTVSYYNLCVFWNVTFFHEDLQICALSHLHEHEMLEDKMNAFVSQESCYNPKYITSHKLYFQISVQLLLARDFI